MASFQLNYNDIDEIFREKLKIQNTVRSIKSIFLNSRYFDKIDYKPYFQRNYVWDDEKATYFIESIILGTEIPPLVFFQTRTKNEVIDGRQRFETIERFLNDKFTLKEKGLHSLKQLAGKKFSQIDEAIRIPFEETRIRILQFEVVNEPRLDEHKEDKIKKEIFKRYNSGITSLQKYDIERAIYIDDPLSNLILQELRTNIEINRFLRNSLLPRSKKKEKERDILNILTSISRELISMEHLTITEYAKTSKTDIVRRTYFKYVTNRSAELELEKFKINIETLIRFERAIINSDFKVKSKQLLFNTLYWIVNIATSNGYSITDDDINKILCIIKTDKSEKIWERINGIPERDYVDLFEPTGSHYYSAIMNRYIFMSNVFGFYYQTEFTRYIKNGKNKSNESLSQVQEYNKYKINKALPETLTTYDIMQDIQASRFQIRPNYQRSEVKNNNKASYLMESVLLGINIPPLFIYKRENDGVKEVVDGQQRLLTLLGYLGEKYYDENNKEQYSEKNKFRLSQLKILKELKGKTIDDLPSNFKDKILDFEMDIIEIDGKQNPEFSPIDLFLRLNSKPYPIKENTFEMWNAYLEKKIVVKAKEISDQYNDIVFRAKEKRMKVEELITSLAYIDYKMKTTDNYQTLLCIYPKKNRLCARINSKSQMTRQLNEISKNDVDNFICSLENVKKFAEKILILTKGDKELMKKLVNHKIKGSSYKTDQNFYFLWLLLYRTELEEIKKDYFSIFEKISNKFKEYQNFNENLTAEKILELFNLN